MAMEKGLYAAPEGIEELDVADVAAHRRGVPVIGPDIGFGGIAQEQDGLAVGRPVAAFQHERPERGVLRQQVLRCGDDLGGHELLIEGPELLEHDVVEVGVELHAPHPDA